MERQDQKKKKESMEGGQSRREFLRTGLGLGALAVTGGLPSSLKEVSAQTAKPKRGGTFTLAMNGSPAQLDPHLIVGNEEVVLGRAMYDSLVWTDHTLTAQPELATSWEPSQNARAWTFHLRKDVRFQHGREFDADDVVYTYTRILNPETASPARKAFTTIEAVKKLDKYTVQFTLDGPFADFPVLVGGNWQARIVPRDVKDLNKNPTGTGPFKLTEFVPVDHATLARNDAYWRDGQPYLDKFRIVFLPEMASHVAGMLGGSLDMSWAPTGDVLPIFKTSKDIEILTLPTNSYQPIVMRVDTPPFNDNRVRQAFKYMCDRETINRVVLGGYGAIGNDHPIPPNSPYYMDQKPRKQDINRAKELLAEAGHKDGLELEMYTWTGRPGLVEMALAFQDMAAKANVRIKLVTVPSDVFLSKYWPGKVPFFNTNWTGRTTLYELLALAYYSDAQWNESHWKTKKMDDLINGIRSETNEAKRKSSFEEIQRMFIDEGPVIIPYHRPRITAVRKRVKGFQPHPTAWVDLRTTWVE